jgi:hypothetical protein
VKGDPSSTSASGDRSSTTASGDPQPPSKISGDGSSPKVS